MTQLRETRAECKTSLPSHVSSGRAIPTQAFEAPAPSGSLVAQAQNSLDLSGFPFQA